MLRKSYIMFLLLYALVSAGACDDGRTDDDDQAGDSDSDSDTDVDTEHEAECDEVIDECREDATYCIFTGGSIEMCYTERCICIAESNCLDVLLPCEYDCNLWIGYDYNGECPVED